MWYISSDVTKDHDTCKGQTQKMSPQILENDRSCERSPDGTVFREEYTGLLPFKMVPSWVKRSVPTTALYCSCNFASALRLLSSRILGETLREFPLLGKLQKVSLKIIKNNLGGMLRYRNSEAALENSFYVWSICCCSVSLEDKFAINRETHGSNPHDYF